MYTSVYTDLLLADPLHHTEYEKRMSNIPRKIQIYCVEESLRKGGRGRDWEAELGWQ